jgi:tRNA(Arg) A34 adenosine deaminase TadA
MSDLTRTEFSHLARAVIVAKQSTMRQRHGALLSRGKAVLALGVNRHRAHPNHVTDPTTESSWHAEVSVLRQLADIDARSIMFVARVNKEGVAMLSEPCENCRKALASAGVRKVIWTATNGYGVSYLD